MTVPMPTSDSTDTGAVTLCELDQTLLSLTSSDDSALSLYARAEGVMYPCIVVPDHIQCPGVQDTSSARPLATLPVKSFGPLSAISRLLESFMLDDENNLSVNRSEFDILQMIRGVCQHIMAPIYHVTGMRSADGLHEQLIINKGKGPVVGLAWHPFKQTIAIIHRNDSVHLFDLTSETWCPRQAVGLHHEFQRGITGIAWCPTGSAVLAVGCKSGVCLWRLQFDVHPTTSTKRLHPLIPADAQGCPQAWMTLLRAPQLSHVSHFAWSPDGRYIVAGSSANSTLVVFDVATESSEALSLSGGPTHELKFSSDGMFLLQSFKRGGIRIWETQLWNSVLLCTKRPAHSLTWLPDIRLFIFGLEGESRIAMVQMTKSAPCLDTITTPLMKLDKLVTLGNGASNLSGIRQFCVSPLGDRMLVQLEGSSQLVLYAIKTKPLPEFSYIGPVYGPMHTTHSSNRKTSAAGPECIAFASQFDKGALACIAYDNGKLSFIPMLFKQ
ncbi:hypothetical protein QVD99_003470 [Batrachochytrium dendrobatidis]|nr:hypothetical protein O5D80_002617 [Batrachochytrium dendrobatidis]KAK5670035.1 hypothetical protein QVD99_003470 [Batrachochytrium dendrobatidis]